MVKPWSNLEHAFSTPGRGGLSIRLYVRESPSDGNYDKGEVQRWKGAITLDFPEYIFSDAIKYRMNDGASSNGNKALLEGWNRVTWLHRCGEIYYSPDRDRLPIAPYPPKKTFQFSSLLRRNNVPLPFRCFIPIEETSFIAVPGWFREARVNIDSWSCTPFLDWDAFSYEFARVNIAFRIFYVNFDEISSFIFGRIREVFNFYSILIVY